MDVQWIGVALSDVTWIVLAFGLGFLSSLVRLPPLVGFLVAGFILNFMGFTGGPILQKLANLGITLLLFTVGLKLDLKSLARPQIWGTCLLHMALITAIFGLILFLLAIIGLPLFTDIGFQQALLIAFALSFSSTVFVVKVLEEKGEMYSRHGKIAIGILIMQDLVAVLFLAVTSGKLPTIWAVLLLLLIPGRFLLYRMLERTGHGELLILFGLVLALGGAELFERVGVKGDLGALIMGVLIAPHHKAKELAKTMLGFKDLFLVGFFLTIGMSGDLTLAAFLIGTALVVLVAIKSVLFMKIMTALKLRARTSLLATLNLSNYSEFGLIVIAIGVTNQWLDGQWLIVMAVALSISFVFAAPLNSADNYLYRTYRETWIAMQHTKRLPDDIDVDTHDAKIAIFGMGRVGSGAYDELAKSQDKPILGIDFNASSVEKHLKKNRNVMVGNPGDPDFWEKIEHNPPFELILLAMPNLQANLAALSQLKEMDYKAEVAAVVRYPDEEEALLEHGIDAVFNIYTEAGAGFAEHVFESIGQKI